MHYTHRKKHKWNLYQMNRKSNYEKQQQQQRTTTATEKKNEKAAEQPILICLNSKIIHWI